MDNDFVQMRIVEVRNERPAGQLVEVVEAEPSPAAPSRHLSIFVAPFEAEAIRFALEHRTIGRPLTHDLFIHALDALAVALREVRITRLSDGVFYAQLVIAREGAAADDPHGIVTVDSRTSDALALAARAGCPIMAAAEVLDEAGYVSPDEAPPEEVLAEFRDFIDSISPEDFE